MPSALVSSLGLMGSSLAAALVRAGWQVKLHHRRPEVAIEAERRGYGVAISDPAQATDCDLAIVCTPVSVIADTVRHLAAILPRAVITDVGSVKGTICEELADLAKTGRFVGSHPMAGSHRQGLNAADPDLYRNRVCIVTPQAGSSETALHAVEHLWQAVGSRTLRLSADIHDRAVAQASHVPHILAALAAMGLDDFAAPVAATGFRDTTRVAAGCPELWADILRHNRDAVLAELTTAHERVLRLRTALEHNDTAQITDWLKAGCTGRQRFEQHGG
jgi:prephenate dehydrogenase